MIEIVDAKFITSAPGGIDSILATPYIVCPQAVSEPSANSSTNLMKYFWDKHLRIIYITLITNYD